MGGAGGGGAGAAFGGATGAFGNALGLPSGPSSTGGAACASMSGATCADAGGETIHAVDNVVVASRTRRSFVMTIQCSRNFRFEKTFNKNDCCVSNLVRVHDQRTIIGPDCGGPVSRARLYFDGKLKWAWHYSAPVHIVGGCCGVPGTTGVDPGKPGSPTGCGTGGIAGPRTGISSGVRPGNSLGCSGSAGSFIGGGTSGCGLPGGLSSGGSAGRPGGLFCGCPGGVSFGVAVIASPDSQEF